MGINKHLAYIGSLRKMTQKEFKRLQKRDWVLEWKQSLNISSLYDDVTADKINAIKVKDVAEQLTLMDGRCMSMIQPRECIQLQWRNAKDLTDLAVLLLIKQFRAVSVFTQMEILEA
eukprot:38303_1